MIEQGIYSLWVPFLVALSFGQYSFGIDKKFVR